MNFSVDQNTLKNRAVTPNESTSIRIKSGVKITPDLKSGLKNDPVLLRNNSGFKFLYFYL